ncbi:MAG: ArsR/SmtB family transcription factor [Succinivibrio sp.]
MNSMDVALICKALCDANRLEIVKMLSDGEKCGCKLLEKFDITQPTLSHHMKILIESGLVNDRREGKWHHYSLNYDALTNYKNFIDELLSVNASLVKEETVHDR